MAIIWPRGKDSKREEKGRESERWIEKESARARERAREREREREREAACLGPPGPVDPLTSLQSLICRRELPDHQGNVTIQIDRWKRGGSEHLGVMMGGEVFGGIDKKRFINNK